MFSRFQSIVNKVNANRSADALEYTEHEKALKLLYALDRSVWDLKVNTIIESAGYETLTVNELFSKLKATEVDNQTRAKLNGAPPSKSVALVTAQVVDRALTLTLLLAFLLPLCLLFQMNSWRRWATMTCASSSASSSTSTTTGRVRRTPGATTAAI